VAKKSFTKLYKKTFDNLKNFDILISVSSNNNKTKNKSMKKNATRGAGRPKYQPKYPKSKFTMGDFLDANGVNVNTGKGKFCTRLTLVKHLKADQNLGNKSLIVKLDETREPNSKSGLGRKTYVYILRSVLSARKATKRKNAANVHVKIGTPAKTVIPTVPVNAISPETEAYEAMKDSLTNPSTPATPSAPADTASEPVAA
jgi:hypothetical protein